ncbi:TPA: porin, partial [Acinetobacter baumannii]|nr:porin [Acinetobacter baumannii]
KNNSMSVYGFDFSYNHNDLVWRGEAAYTKTDSNGSEDLIHKKNNLTVVMGPEWSLKNSTLSLVGVYKHTEDFKSADNLTNPLVREVYRYQQTISDQYEQDQYGAMLRYALNLLNDNLKLEFTGFYFAPEPNELLRVRINYNLNDHWQLNAGGDRFWGRNDTVLGQFRDNSLVYAQVRYNF